MNYEIDFVITWVDGSDKIWQAQKQNYLPDNKNSKNEERYRDWDILKYWFRSIEKYAPWVRKIHFITCGHLPYFLNINHPKLNIVKHSDYIPSEYLPTFSSHPIEMNMHRINDLSEHFVYFNDDMFINKQVKKNDFFVNGKPCYEAIEALIQDNDINDVYWHILLNNISLINKNFSKRYVYKTNILKWINLKYGKDLLRNLCLLPWPFFQNIICRHLAVPFLKSTIAEVWEKEGDVLNKTSLNKFRMSTDVNQYIFRYWDIMKGNFYPKHINGQAYHINDKCIDNLCNDIVKGKHKLICVNDGIEANFEKHCPKIISAFNQRFPEKSSFEK